MIGICIFTNIIIHPAIPQIPAASSVKEMLSKQKNINILMAQATARSLFTASTSWKSQIGPNHAFQVDGNAKIGGKTELTRT